MSERDPKLSPREMLQSVVYWRRSIGLIWAAAPYWTVTWAILLLFQGIQPLASVYLLKLLVDALVNASRSGGDWSQVRPAIVLVCLTVGVTLLGEILQSASELVRTAQSELVQDHIKGLVHERSATMDLSVHDSAE